MRLILLLLAALPVFGLSNCVTLHEAASLSTSQRPLVIHRWFAEGEIAGYPKPFIGGVAPSAWQADVKARWDDGTVRLAYISWRQDISANGSVTACFENSTNRSSAGNDSATNAAALSQAQMLAFDTGSGAGSWNGIIEATLNSITYTANAKTMLTDGNWSYWLRGPVVTWVVAEDRTSALSYDFGWEFDAALNVSNRLASTNLFPSVDDTRYGVFVDFRSPTTVTKGAITSFTMPSHGLVDGQSIRLSGFTSSWVSVNGVRVVTVTGPNTFTIPVDSSGFIANAPGGSSIKVQPYLYSTGFGTSNSATPTDGAGVKISGSSFVLWVRSGGVETTYTIGSADSSATRYVEMERDTYLSAPRLTAKWDGGQRTICASGCNITVSASWFSSAFQGLLVQEDNGGNTVSTNTDLVRFESYKAPTSNTYKSLHPIFCLQFWPDPDGAGSLTAWPGVEVDAILWNASTTRLQRVPLNSLLVNTGDGTVTSYSVGYANMYARRTWHTVVWSGTAPTDVVVDHNLKYMIHSWALPTLDYEATMASTVADTDLSRYTSQLGSDLPEFPYTNTGTAANWAKYVATTGARGDIALIPRWYLRYLFAMGNSNFSVAKRLDIWNKLVMGNAEAATSYPAHYLETDSSSRAAGFGRPIEITYRPTLTLRSNYILGDEDAGGVDAPVYACSAAPCDARAANLDTPEYYGKWKPDTAHQPSFFAMPFLLTGRPFYLWEQQFVAAWNIAAATAGRSGTIASPACSDGGLNSYGRWNSWGIAYPSANWRAHVWTVRDFYLAAALSPDSTSEKAYFVNLLKNNDEVIEGYYNIRDGLYPPADPYCTGYNQATTSDKWCSGLMSQRFFGNNPLRIPTRGQPQSSSALQFGSTACSSIGFAFQYGYAANVYPWIANSRAILHNGQPVFSTAKREIGKFMAEWTLHPDSNQFRLVQLVPTLKIVGGTLSYPQSWSEFSGIYLTTLPLNASITSTSTSIQGAGATNSGTFSASNLGAIKIDDEWILVCSYGYGSPTTFNACTNGRGAWGTTATAHTVGATINFYPMFRSSEFQGGYEWIQRAARASLADVSSGNYSNRRAFEWFNSNALGRDQMNNPANTMQSPQWAFRPRDEITNVRATAGTGALALRWVAPSGEACKVRVAGTAPTSSDDSSDATATVLSREQSYSASGLAAGTVYYRISCGTARAAGTAVVQ